MNRLRVVVIGAGMAGVRLAEEIADRAGPGEPRVAVTVLGAEHHLPYNRIQLTNVLAGDVSSADIVMGDTEWYRDRGHELRLGVRVRGVDRDGRRVLLADGSVVHYDVLVLATGSEPLVPPVRGLLRPDGRPREGVFFFRTLDDCRGLRAAAAVARRVVVIGGGVLGLETARALTRHGPAVTILHRAPRLMDRQLDGPSAGLLRRVFADLGIESRVDATAVAIDGAGPALEVALDDGERLPADLVVVSCGVRPRTDLAVACGLDVDRGIVIGDDLRTSDPRVYAIGDCAQYRDDTNCLLDPAWAQARVLAARLTDEGTGVRYGGVSLVTRLKADGIDLVAMGDTLEEEAGDEPDVVLFSDLGRRTYKKLVIRDGRLVGAVLLGDGQTNGTVTQIFDRGAAVPSDPKVLLFAGLGSGVRPDLSRLPDDATVCYCNTVTKGRIVEAHCAGAHDFAAVSAATRCGTGCGTCRADVEDILAALPVLPEKLSEELPEELPGELPGGLAGTRMPETVAG